MGSKADRRADKRPLPPLDPAAKRSRERELQAQAKARRGTARLVDGGRRRRGG